MAPMIAIATAVISHLITGSLADTVSANGDEGFTYVLSYNNPDGTGNTNVGETAFNELFWGSENKILARDCPNCESEHKWIYYKRLTNADVANIYYLTADWMTVDSNGYPNVLGTDFALYSTLGDALADTNAWTFCNYDDAGVGMFRDCGVTGYVASEWTAATWGEAVRFYIYTPEDADPCANVLCEDADFCTVGTCNPESGVCDYTPVDCNDNDGCTDDECVEGVGCVTTAVNCDDGDVCNGEESCVADECVSAGDFSCPINFVCDSGFGGCLRDCNTLAIDGYLLDCSAEFDDNENELAAIQIHLGEIGLAITALETDIATNAAGIVANADAIVQTNVDLDAAEQDIANNAADIANNGALIVANGDLIAANTADIVANDADIATNAADIATNAAGIGANGASIVDLQNEIAAQAALIAALDARIADLESRVTGLGPVAGQQEGDGSNTRGSDNEKESVLPLFWLQFKNEILLVLALANIALLVCWLSNCCKRKPKYEEVELYSSDENAALN